MFANIAEEREKFAAKATNVILDRYAKMDFAKNAVVPDSNAADLRIIIPALSVRAKVEFAYIRENMNLIDDYVIEIILWD
jgi:hypothetical protein